MLEVIFKACTKCGVSKALSEYYKDRSKRSGLRSYCKTCSDAAILDWRRQHPERKRAIERACIARNPERARARHSRANARYAASGKQRLGRLRHRGAIVINVELSELVPAQDQVCEICDTSKPRGQGSFHKDHCHSTGKLRGWLCHPCNLHFERLHPEAPLYAAAQAYLLKYA